MNYDHSTEDLQNMSSLGNLDEYEKSELKVSEFVDLKNRITSKYELLTFDKKGLDYKFNQPN